MPLIYALVSRGVSVLAEHTANGLTGNFSSISRVLLKKIPDEDGRCSYVYSEYVFHYIVSKGLIYLTMSDSQFTRTLAFAFLAELESQFTQMFPRDKWQTAIAFQFNSEFSRNIAQQMELYNAKHDAGDERVNAINNQLGQVKSAMLSNIDSVLARGEKIELLVDKSEALDQNAMQFNRSARTLKTAMCRRNAKWTAIVVAAIILVLYMILAMACGGASLPNC